MLRLSRDQSNNIGKFFFQWSTPRTTPKFTVHRRKTKPDIKHIFTRLTEQKSFISSCIIIASIKCPFWQVSILKIGFRGNVHSAKCTFWQESILENRFSGKCPFGQMYILASVRSGKCNFWKVYVQGNVHSGKCTFWEMYIWDNIHSDKCFSGKCPFWKVFFGEMYRIRFSHAAYYPWQVKECNQIHNVGTWWIWAAHFFQNDPAPFFLSSVDINFVVLPPVSITITKS